LNRLAYGPRPGDVEAVAKEGAGAWIRRQMNPSAIPADALEAKLHAFPTLTMSIAQLNQQYPRPRAAATKAGIARDDPAAGAEARDALLSRQRDVSEGRARRRGARPRAGTTREAAGSGAAGRGDDDARCAAQTAASARAQRELRARAPRAPHARRRRRLHAAG